MKYRVFLACMLLVILCLPAALATTKELKILAVAETENGDLVGNIADLKVELIPGEGRIFIDTYPLTKIDTQVSTRIAKEIACAFTQRDCSNHDFIYTIRSGSPAIGGPSASAAVAALTVAALDNLPVDQGVTITGTIGSGGLVGSVGGVKSKIEAAAQYNIHTALIPAGERFVINATNISMINNNSENQTRIDIIERGTELGLRVKEVYTLHQIVEEISGVTYPQQATQINPPAYYSSTMQQLASQLCQRAEEKRELAQNLTPTSNQTNITAIILRAEELNNASIQAIDLEQFYAAASYCFGAAQQYNLAFWSTQNLSTINQTAQDLLEYAQEFPTQEIKTVTDLQTFMLVQERVQEVQDRLEAVTDAIQENNTQLAQTQLAFAQERLYSAQSWSAFFDVPGPLINLDDQILARACDLRIQEAQERQQYVQIYGLNQGSNNDIQQAFSEKQQKNYPMCIFYASKAKAGLDLIIRVINTQEEVLPDQLNAVVDVAKQEINEQIQNDIFPIAAFSYVEYAQSLAETDTYSGLLYAQYGIELSDISIYIEGEQHNKQPEQQEFEWTKTQFLLLGIAIGMFASILCMRIEMMFRKRPKRQHLKRDHRSK